MHSFQINFQTLLWYTAKHFFFNDFLLVDKVDCCSYQCRLLTVFLMIGLFSFLSLLLEIPWLLSVIWFSKFISSYTNQEWVLFHNEWNINPTDVAINSIIDRM